MRRWGAAVVCCLGLSACTGSPPRPPTAAPTSIDRSQTGIPSSGGGPFPTVPPPVSPKPLPGIVLTADLGEPPAEWAVAARIPFGRREAQLGLVTDPNRTPVPYIPRAFAITPAGSLLFLDVVNRRVATFAFSGRLLGAVGGLYFDRLDAHPRDVAVAGGRAYVLEEYDDAGSAAGISEVRTAATWSFAPMMLEGRHAIGHYLVDSSDSPVAWVIGFGDLASGVPDLEPSVYAAVDREGVVHPIPGVPVAPESWIRTLGAAGAGPNEEQSFTITYTTPTTQIVRPLLIRVVAQDGNRPRSLHAVAVVRGVAAAPHLLLAYVQLSPTRQAEQERFGGGRWLLGVPDDGSPIIWERMPEPGVSDEQQVRFLAAGPDGAIYLMVPEPNYELILRRPGG
jgi:hypothetical protein